MRWVRVTTAAGLFLAAIGCNSILGIEEARLDDGGNGTGGNGTGGNGTGGGTSLPSSCDVATDDDACTVCDKTACCDSLSACLDEPDCTATVSCIGDCSDTTCTAQCLSDHPTGGALAAVWSSCLSTACSEACGSTAQSCAAFPDPSLVQSCVLAMACDPWPFTNISNCISLGSVYSIPFLSCANGAQTCEQVGACLGRHFGDPAACGGGDSAWTCDGSVAQSCSGGESRIVDCSYWGATCVSGTAWPCVLPIGPCGETDNLWHCSGDNAYVCADGQPHGQDCIAESGTCVESTPGDAYCSHSATTCADHDVQTCNGDSMTYCNGDGYFYQYDCSLSTGGTCQNFSGTSTGYCFSPGCAPDAQCTESCDGSVMTLCVGLAPLQVDCTQYGFSSCTTDTNTSGYTYATCVK